MNKESLICLDPVNLEVLLKGIGDGVKTFVGGNCTVSLLLMASPHCSRIKVLNGYHR